MSEIFVSGKILQHVEGFFFERPFLIGEELLLIAIQLFWCSETLYYKAS